MASIKYLFAISFLVIIAFNFVLSAPVSSQEAAAAEENDSEDSSENEDKPIPAKISNSDNAPALNDQDTNESSDTDKEEASGVAANQQQSGEHAHKHRDHSKHLNEVVEDDSKTKKVDENDDDDESESEETAVKSQKSSGEKATALEADKPAATSQSEEEIESDNRKPLADNTYPKAPAATAAEDRQQQSREIIVKDSKSDDDSETDDDSDDDQKNEEVPAPAKGSGTMTQEESEGVANLTEDKQIDERQDGEEGIAVPATTMKSPNSGVSVSASFSLIFLSIMLYLLQ